MTLDGRLRARLESHGATSKRMFGGTCFLIGGNMLIGTLKEGLVVRVGKPAHAEAVKRPGARTFDMTGKPMEGFVTVSGKALDDEAELDGWISLALDFAKTLPPKPAAPVKRPKAR